MDFYTSYAVQVLTIFFLKHKQTRLTSLLNFYRRHASYFFSPHETHPTGCRLKKNVNLHLISLLPRRKQLRQRSYL